MRWPFRILAAAICLAVISVVALGAFAFWVGKLRAMDTRTIVWVPGMLWLSRHAYHAARYGRTAPESWWPLASESVAQWYFMLALIGSYI